MAPRPETAAATGASGTAGHPTAPGQAASEPAGPVPGASDSRRPDTPRDGGPEPARAQGAASPSPGESTRPRRLWAAVRRRAPRAVVAVAGGVALSAAFPPYDLWPLSLLAVAALSLLTLGRTARQGAWVGFAFGFSFFFLLLRWLNVVGWDAVLGLALVQALFLALLGAGLAVSSRLPGWPLWAACLWVAEEWARDRVPLGGFPWGRLAFAHTASPLTPLAAVGGAPLVTFAVALTGALLGAATLALWRLYRAPAGGPGGDGRATEDAGATERTGAPVPGRARAALRTVVPPVALAGAVGLAGHAVPVPTDADDTVDIAVVQGNVQNPGMDFLGRPMLILENHVEATLALARDVEAGRTPRPDLVIWPENASDLDPYKFPEARAAIERAVSAVGVPVLVGALVDHPTKEGYVENQGIVWDPEEGPGASYTKQHPVPFGEYVPFREQLSKVISRLERVPRDFSPGDRTGVLDVGPARLGDVICFEVAYDEIVRDTVTSGARALVIQTNNATYGRTGQPEQQLAMSRLRAVEHGRAIVTAATSGISAVVAPDGTILQRTEEFTRDVLTASLPLRDDTTLADRLGSGPEWTLAMVGLLSCATALVLGRRGRKDEEGQQ